MNLLDRSRRAVSITVVATALVLLPSAALARFSVPVPPKPTLQVSAATMVAPTAVVGTFICNGTAAEAMRVTITNFTDTGPGATAYDFTLTSQYGASASTSAAVKSATLVASDAVRRNSTVWTITIGTRLSAWTSPVWSKQITCTKKTTTGAL